MNAEKFSDALGKIDVGYVEEVMAYKAKRKPAGYLWKLAAACAAIIVLTIGVLPLFHKDKKNASDFTLIAYAAQNGTVVENKIQEGTRVPISFFETETGLKGFVFACDKNSPGEISAVSVMTEGEFSDVLEEIVGLKLGTDKNYVFYIPEQEKGFPYRFMLTYTDMEANLVHFCYLMVEETDDGYSAVIERVENVEWKGEE